MLEFCKITTALTFNLIDCIIYSLTVPKPQLLPDAIPRIILQLCSVDLSPCAVDVWLPRSKGVTGELLVNGLPKEESKFRKMSCYITQEDLLQPMLTLNELMMFAADLKLSSSTRKEKKLVVSCQI
ncbi:hypothetical protein J6590_025215 [Homalodisca vitripennis]|nr:hypothetical protein J6590_025215 [Homalodisca vitripennis]